MLEGIGAYLINYYLGEFLEDINNDQLSGAKLAKNPWTYLIIKFNCFRAI